MTPEQKAREIIDKKLEQSGWIVQDMKQLNLFAGLGVAVREFPTSTGPVDYALFVDGTPVGIIEAKKDDAGENITAMEGQSNRYVNSTFKWIKGVYRIRFVYEATGKLTRFTDYDDIKYRSRSIFTFHQPQELQRLMKQPDTIRNRMKQFPDFDTTGFRKCQITAISNLEKSFASNKPKALIQMATGAGKTFTAITTVYRLLKHTGVNRVLFLVDTKGLGEQAEREFLAYLSYDDPRSFSELYNVLSFLPMCRCVSAPSSGCILSSEARNWMNPPKASPSMKIPPWSSRLPRKWFTTPSTLLNFSMSLLSTSATAPSTMCGSRCWSISTPSRSA